jgi:hypothetical protein
MALPYGIRFENSAQQSTLFFGESVALVIDTGRHGTYPISQPNHPGSPFRGFIDRPRFPPLLAQTFRALPGTGSALQGITD